MFGQIARVAQLDRASASGAEGCGFDPRLAHQFQMKFKTILLGLCLLALIVGVGALYLDNTKLKSEAAALRSENEQMHSARAAEEDSAGSQLQKANDELGRLRKDNEELLRLRNEVHQLRDEKAQLGKQVQTAQAQALNAQAQSAQAQAQAEALRLKAAQTPPVLTPEQQALQARYATNLTPEQAANVCINNLRQIDGAMQQWALEYKKTADAIPTAADITPYLPGNKLPACPSGGAYTLNKVSDPPTCSIPGHALPK